MRKILKRYLPHHDSIRANRWLAVFGESLFHPRLWHLNRHSVAGGFAAGLFCGLIPGPFQMLFAGVCAVAFRVNLPLALLTTLYTNPFTIVPLYLVAYRYGRILYAEEQGFVPPPEFSLAEFSASLDALLAWMAHLGKPLFLGLLLLACTLAALGYLLTRLAWRAYLILAWRQRCKKRGIHG